MTAAARTGALSPAPEAGVTVVIPNWNGRRWLSDCLQSVAAQRPAPAQTIIVDNGSTDGSLGDLRARHDIEVIALGHNTGFAFAVNRGIEAARHRYVALLNTDIVLEAGWLARMAGALDAHPGAASVACKMLSLHDRSEVYDAGDILRRDGVCEQRGRFLRDDGAYEEPIEIFGACAGAALYRRDAVLALGGFDERFFAYLEDVDLALRLQMAGWSCRYEPAIAYHAGEGSSHRLKGGHRRLVERNTLLLVAKAFPARWLPYVAYRQLAWAVHAWREHTAAAFGRGALEALMQLPRALRCRRALRATAVVPVQAAVPARPIRGPRAGGHPAHHPASVR